MAPEAKSVLKGRKKNDTQSQRSLVWKLWISREQRMSERSTVMTEHQIEMRIWQMTNERAYCFSCLMACLSKYAQVSLILTNTDLLRISVWPISYNFHLLWARINRQISIINILTTNHTNDCREKTAECITIWIKTSVKPTDSPLLFHR